MDYITESKYNKDIEKYERKIFDLRQLIEISKGLNSTLEYNVLIDSILLTCMGQMQLIKAGIFLRKSLDDDTYVLHRNYKGFELNHENEYIIPGFSPLIKILAESSSCITFEEIQEKLSEDSKSLQTLYEIKPSLIVPLRGKGKLNGIIVLGERINQFNFDEEEKEYLLDIASLAGIAIENAYLYELATTDMMTKLKIHHYFQTILIEEREKAIKRKTPLSLILIDIDHFKNFNDTYGHLCGDIVLKRVAQIILENCRQNDIAARYGGEEMSIILPRTDMEAAIIAAERIRRSIEKDIVEYESKKMSVTVSIGITEMDHSTDKTNNDLILRADKALYLAKENGRNRLAFITP